MAVGDFVGGLTGRAGDAYILGMDGLLKSLNRASADVNKEIRKRSRAIAQEEARNIKDAAKSAPNPRQASLAAISVQGRSDRAIYISGGGSRVLRTTKTMTLTGGATKKYKRSRPLKAAEVFFGSEFGSKLPQFPPHAGKQGYWFWPTLRRDWDKVVAKYMDSIEAALRNFGANG